METKIRVKIRLLGAGDVSLDVTKVKHKQYLEDLSYIEIESNLVPYTSPEEYEELVNKAENTGTATGGNQHGRKA